MRLQLTAEQHAKLLEELPQFRVRELRGQSHLEAWDVRRTLIRIFGFGGFDIETKKKEVVAQIEHPPTNPGGRSRWSVVYTAEIRLTIKNPDGSVGAVYEDGASGDSQNQPSLGDAHDQALKTALSQGLKRCAVNLGDQFGLSLYNGGKTKAVVNRTLVGGPGAAAPADLPADEAPVQGEPEPQHDAPASEPETSATQAAGSAADQLAEQIAAASDKDQLGAAWKAIGAATNAQAITVEQRNHLQEAWKRRKAEVLPKNPGNDAARRHMMALFGQVGLADKAERDARMAYVVDAVQRDVASTNDLTDAEVRAVIGRLERWIEQDTPPQDAELAGTGAR
ncbi:Rad52/Rad22 family DNA repair protein [Actinoplanes aureus]|uniref:Uncharacterized protein n=1 Tax=Actinoplanes aureus TaxID=2792083 RepID=A0A931FVX2_9ACTN|nr:Rad52/Rad22 family DNA repair protein [Actinoplanes aureus]MBG0560700.1 hypothetical protein [Actinoplanes aureus]